MTKEINNPKRGTVNVVAIIPARGGKQSIPYKNLQKLGGKTLLAWAVEVAMATDSLDAVLVSTEDKRIAQEATRLGAIVVPRPKKYAQPHSSDAGFYHHAVQWMEKEKGWRPELLVNLRPTGPLRFVEDINAMVQHMLDNPEVDGLKSIIPAPLHPYKMWLMEEGGGSQDKNNKTKKGAKKNRVVTGQIGTAGKITPVFDNEFRRQKGPDQPRQLIQEKWPVFWQDGQVDITRRKFILSPDCLKNDNVWGNNLHGYVLDERTSVDLDTREDFRRAEKLYKEMNKERQ